MLDKYDIQVFFYIGGNDSMDTVYMLSEYAKYKNINKQIIGVPKTIDNDLVITDHTPGFGSAAKFIATTVLETYFDSSVYKNNGIFILETMGRDTGWLAASAALARVDGESAADFIYLPETAFDEKKFIEDVSKRFKEKGKVYIVASEGIKDAEGNYMATIDSNALHDKFGHAQLGGVCGYLKGLIINNNITSRVKTLELGVLQRCAMHCVSKTDIDETYTVGQKALEYALQGATGSMVAIRRLCNNPYESDTIVVNASEVANKIKHFPAEWINAEKNHINNEAIDYITPLINGLPELTYNNGLPVYSAFKK
jgi:6-phosphofructokinase 1